MEASMHRMILVVLNVVLFATAEANIGEYDEVWEKRAKDANKTFHEAYNPNPEDVIHHINHHVHK